MTEQQPLWARTEQIARLHELITNAQRRKTRLCAATCALWAVCSAKSCRSRAGPDCIRRWKPCGAWQASTGEGKSGRRGEEERGRQGNREEGTRKRESLFILHPSFFILIYRLNLEERVRQLSTDDAYCVTKAFSIYFELDQSGRSQPPQAPSARRAGQSGPQAAARLHARNPAADVPGRH